MEDSSSKEQDSFGPINVQLPSKSSPDNPSTRKVARNDMAVNVDNGSCRDNVKLIALTDIVLGVIIIVALTAYLIELIMVIHAAMHSVKGITITAVGVVVLLVLAVGGIVLILISFECFCAIMLIKAVKSDYQKSSIKMVKLWLLYNLVLQLVILGSIAVSFLYGSKGVAAASMGYFIIRVMFIVVTFRYLQELDPGMIVAVGPEHGPETEMEQGPVVISGQSGQKDAQKVVANDELGI